MNLLNWISYYNRTITDIQSFYASGNGEFFHNIISLTNYDSIVVGICICLFELFSRLSLPYNRIINSIAQATFMIYLLHENAFFRSACYHFNSISLLFGKPLLYLIVILLWTLLAFILGIVGYYVYSGIRSLVKKREPITNLL